MEREKGASLPEEDEGTTGADRQLMHKIEGDMRVFEKGLYS